MRSLSEILWGYRKCGKFVIHIRNEEGTPKRYNIIRKEAKKHFLLTAIQRRRELQVIDRISKLGTRSRKEINTFLKQYVKEKKVYYLFLEFPKFSAVIR